MPSEKHKKIHIVHIIPTLRRGGAERTVVDIVNNADKDRFHFTILVFFEDIPMKDQITNHDVEILVVKKRGKISLGFFGDVRRALIKLKPDIVHTHLFGADVWGRVAARRLGIPVVSTEHNIDEAEGSLKHEVKRKLRKYSNRYVACSTAVASYAKRMYGVERSEVIRPGISLQRFERIRPAPFVPPIRFLMLGRLTKQKGHTIAIHALAQIPKDKWHLTIVGDGKRGSALMMTVQHLKLSDNIDFLPATGGVPSVFRSTDIVLIPSLWEGLGIVAMEAMASGRLVIASKTGGLKEIVKHKKNGLLFRAGDVRSLTNTLIYCMQNDRACKKIAEIGREYAHAHFGIDQAVGAYENIYINLAKR